jgi:hypothetical protein
MLDSETGTEALLKAGHPIGLESRAFDRLGKAHLKRWVSG